MCVLVHEDPPSGPYRRFPEVFADLSTIDLNSSLSSVNDKMRAFMNYNKNSAILELTYKSLKIVKITNCKLYKCLNGFEIIKKDKKINY